MLYVTDCKTIKDFKETETQPTASNAHKVEKKKPWRIIKCGQVKAFCTARIARKLLEVPAVHTSITTVFFPYPLWTQFTGNLWLKPNLTGMKDVFLKKNTLKDCQLSQRQNQPFWGKHHQLKQSATWDETCNILVVNCHCCIMNH